MAYIGLSPPTSSSEWVTKSMKGNKGKNTKPELLLRSQLHRLGLRFRIHYKKVSGHPDIAFPSKKLAVFVDGCFWHRCPKCYKEPKTNTDFWRKKVQKNRDHAKIVESRLYEIKWCVIRVWEHNIKEDLDKVAMQIKQKIRGYGPP